MFLQGHPSLFARNVANELEQRGYDVHRINFCLGDALVWLGRPSTNFRKPFSRWEGYLTQYLLRHGVTDIVYYGDRKPYHQVASKLGRSLGISCYSYEFGYLRPDWITLERGGMSAFSHFPNDPSIIHQIAAQCDEVDEENRFPYSKPREIVYEVTYNLVTYFSRPFFPFYRADRYYNPLIEYISGIPGLILEKRNHRQARQLTNSLIRKKKPFFLFSLQLQSDYQLRSNAPFSHQKEALAQTLVSFAKHADKDTHLVFKAHPLDNGWEGWRRFLRSMSRAYHLEDRIHFIVGGNLTHMVHYAKGCVMINSTVGLHAVRAGCPVKVLGWAIYDIEGLTYQGDLDSFWTKAVRPNPDLTHDLVKAMAATIQVKGNFFTTKGQRSAIPRFADMLIEKKVNGKGAFIDPPPRLAGLKAIEPPMFDYEPPSETKVLGNPASDKS